jgi:saccharopine dehydrogenase-like NADP-dependent oxidoreductase
MGRWAVRSIVRLGSAHELLVADRDVVRAQQISDEVGGPCRAVQLDATDGDAMRTAFNGCDVVLNTMGPFSLFAGGILEAAIDAGCDYLDIDDDWESTVEAFELNDVALAKGVRVIKGAGGSPGVSNLLALTAARQLDTVSELVTGWSMGGAVLAEEPGYPAPDSGGAAVEHWLLQISGNIRGWRNGGYAQTTPLERVELDYPGLGRVCGYTVGHPEAITLPRYIDGVVTSLNMTSGPAWLFEHARSVATAYDSGEISLREGARQLNHPPRTGEGRQSRDPLGSVWAYARGQRAGQDLSVSVAPRAMPAGKMGEGTGAALAVGLELLRQGKVSCPGVHAPESVFEPADFFGLYARFVEPATAPDELLVIQELAGATPLVEGVSATA